MHYGIRLGGLALSCLPLIACQDQLATSSAEAHPATLHISHSERAIYARAGEFAVAAFDLQASEPSGAPARYCPVAIEIVSGPGEVVPSIAAADSSGVVRGLFYALATESVARSLLRAATSSDTIHFTIFTYAIPDVEAIEFISPPRELLLPPGKPSTFTLLLQAKDAAGVTLPGVDLRLSLRRGSAAVSRIRKADAAGVYEAEIRFSGVDFTPLEFEAVAVSSVDLLDSFGAAGIPQRILQKFSGSKSRVIAQLSIAVRPSRSLKLSLDMTSFTGSARGSLRRVVVRAYYDDGEAAAGVKLTVATDPPAACLTPALQTNSDGTAAATLAPVKDREMIALRIFAPDYGVEVQQTINGPTPNPAPAGEK